MYLTRNDLAQILVNNENSPYQSQAEEPFRCCCSGLKTPRSRTPRSRTPRMQISKVVTNKPQPQVDLTLSEKDPLCSLDNSSSKLCKGMLEDLLLKGFKCCKCIDETDGELEDGSSFDDESVSECEEDMIKQDNCLMHSTEDRNCNDIEEAKEEPSRNSPDSSHFQPSVGNSWNSAVDAESGIEVTGSDFHSSAATNLDHQSASFSYVKYEGKSRNVAGYREKEEQEKTVNHLEGRNDIGVERNELAYAGKDPTKHCPTFNNEILNGDYDVINLRQNEQEVEDNPSHDNANVNSTVSEEVETTQSKLISHGQLSETCNASEENDAMQQSKLSNNVDVDSPVSEKNHVLNDECNVAIDKQSTGCMPREVSNLRLNALALDEQYQLSSSEDSYRTSEEILDTEEPLYGLKGTYDAGEEHWVNNGDLDALLDEDEESVVHVCKRGKNRVIECEERDGSQGECSKNCKQNDCHGQCCEVRTS